MDITVHRERIRAQITHMEVVNAKRRREPPACLPVESRAALQDLEAQWDHLPQLPSTLPGPQYALVANLIGQNDSELDFYLACEQGLLDDVVNYIRDIDPLRRIVLQYALEQASFGGQSAVARYLIKNGATLHSNIFSRSEDLPPREKFFISIFTAMRRDLEGNVRNQTNDVITLLKPFLEAGWPNKAWYSTDSDAPCAPFDANSCTQQLLLGFLLEHGADPNLASHERKFHGARCLNRQSGRALNTAINWEPARVSSFSCPTGRVPVTQGYYTNSCVI